MSIRRRLVTAIGVISLAAAAAGCTGDPAPAPAAVPSTSPSSAPAATDQLTAALDGFRTGTVSFTGKMTGPLQVGITGRFDGVSGDATVTSAITADGRLAAAELIRIGDDLWIRQSGATRDAWQHANVDEVSADGPLRRSLTDPSASEKLLRAAFDVGRSGDGMLVGKLDMTTSSLLGTGLPATAAAQLKQVPFRAALDAQGRLARLEIDLRYVLRLRADGGVLVVEYTGYGEPIALKPPTGKIVEMDAAALARL
ncbi:hypothetical protein CS0771_30110 [Catellatospora sp. IY07-71]|uniref:hypothetical protein n=1 Tax=Catellatospora sp. IY07-71 TaxID=2728827 RepID=UPI001BB3E843|nr:hypothetical protein [Catellatospora sp. IY07-71]BCJ73467.1 hypothetical protein CS0771_30110 [Catellatospora sp. IY07-71]